MVKLWVSLLGCGADCPDGYGVDNDGQCVALDLGGAAEGSTAEAALEPLASPRLLRRASLDLRGVLPGAADLDAVEADPGALDGYLDAYLDDPRLEDRLVHLLAERWHTRIDEFLIFYLEYPPLSDEITNEYPFERAVGEEPLRLIARVVAEDRPWSEIVTADWTMADETLAAIWPVERGDGEGWQPATYTDGRPTAGVLSTNGLWWRYYTTEANYNRTRVAAVTRLLICEDYLGRPVSFSESPSLADAEGTEEALRSDPYCMGCHSSIDPIASTLFGFWVLNEYNAQEMDTYHPEREALGEPLTGFAPAWFGEPLGGLSDLGQAIAADERFTACAAETFAELLWRRPPELIDFERIEALQSALLENDRRPKAMIRALLDGEIYRAGALGAGATAEDEAREQTARLLAPDQLASAVEDLTGFTWRYEGFEQMDNDTWGFRILAGGVNGVNVTSHQTTPSLTWEQTIRRLTQGAAGYAVQQDLVEGAIEAPIFDGVSLDTTPDDPEFSAWLEATHWRLYGERPDAAWIEAASELWHQLYGNDGAEEAWAGMAAVLMRDPLFVTY